MVTPPSPAPQRSSGIDVTRAVAALAVLASHLLQTLTWRLPGWEAAAAPATSARLHALTGTLGAWGVALFFVVSGACIHLPQARALTANPDARLAVLPYLRRRVTRIYPPYLGALVLSVAVAWGLPAALRSSTLLGVPSLPALAANLLLVHTLFPAHAEAVNAVFWTIALEAQFYLAYPLLLALRRRVGIGWTCAALIATMAGTRLLAQAALSPVGIAMLAESLLRRGWEFGLGMWVAERLAADPRPRPGARLAWAGLAALALTAGLLLALLPGGLRARAILWPLLFAVAVEVAARWDGPAAPLERAGRWLGERSYSLYLVHPVGLAVGLWAWRSWGGGRVIGAGLMLGCAAAVFVAFYALVERRFAGRGAAASAGPASDVRTT